MKQAAGILSTPYEMRQRSAKTWHAINNPQINRQKKAPSKATGQAP
jgi:hypothetical protein